MKTFSNSSEAPLATAEPDGPRFTPLYLQIHGLLTRSLQTGEWLPGELIPGEQDLAARFHVSQGTVRKAIDRLVAENILVRRQGRGTFVASHQEPRSQFRFLRLRGNDDEVPTFFSRILDCRRQRAPQEVAKQLGLRPGEGVVHIQRVLEFSGVPTVLDHIWLPGGRFKGLTAERLAGYQGPLYALFETEFGTRMLGATERVKAMDIDAESAAVLQIDTGSAVLLVERQSRTYEGEIVEFRSGIYRTDKYHYLGELG